jgi:hypothetical protein
MPGVGSVVEKLRTAWVRKHRRGPSTPRRKPSVTLLAGEINDDLRVPVWPERGPGIACRVNE